MNKGKIPKLVSAVLVYISLRPFFFSLYIYMIHPLASKSLGHILDLQIIELTYHYNWYKFKDLILKNK